MHVNNKYTLTLPKSGQMTYFLEQQICVKNMLIIRKIHTFDPLLEDYNRVFLNIITPLQSHRTLSRYNLYSDKLGSGFWLHIGGFISLKWLQWIAYNE